MPKSVDYPRKPWSIALKVADAIYSLGGSATNVEVADKLNQKLGGSFGASLSAAHKFGLIDTRKGQLITTNDFKVFKLAYDDSERQSQLQKFVLTPPLYLAIARRFNNLDVPSQTFLEKLLIRDHSIAQDVASYVVSTMMSAFEMAGLLVGGKIRLSDVETGTESFEQVLDRSDSEASIDKGNASLAFQQGHTGNNIATANPVASTEIHNTGFYTFTIVGPDGTRSHLQMNDDESIQMVELYLKKIKRMLQEKIESK